MAGKTTAIYNQAGGVGKSTLALNLGYHLARAGQRVLLVDNDPQGSLTIFAGFNPDEQEYSTYHLLGSPEQTPQPLSAHRLELIPANVSLAVSESLLYAQEARNPHSPDWRERGSGQLRLALELLRPDYDHILIDCLPSLGILSYNGLFAADMVLVPCQTQLKSVRALAQLSETLAQPNLNHLTVVGIVPTVYNPGYAHDNAALQAIREAYPEVHLFPALRRTTALPNASAEGLPLALFQPSHPVVEVFEQIAEQFAHILSAGQAPFPPHDPTVRPSQEGVAHAD